MNKLLEATVEEIFTSIQGEGPYIGVKQLFVRFCGCNLQCAYCDTMTGSENAKTYDTDKLAERINAETDIHSVSITGGEPLLHSEFLAELFPKLNVPVYLETNGTMSKELKKVISFVDFIAADYKLKSAAGRDLTEQHEEFLSVCSQFNKEVFLKVVFDENITENEISEITGLAKKFNVLLVLQPMMKNDKLVPCSVIMQEVFNKCVSDYQNVRLIPQTHKFLNLM